MSELVTVEKSGEPTLRIHRTTLAQHIKLGWKHVEDVVNEFIAPSEKAEEPVKAEDSKSAKKQKFEK